jgi:UDP-N-acetylmuramate--alanine ligase
MKVHFIGIGGIGVSALAQYYLAKGAEVSGSDLASSEITDLLERKGAKVFFGEHKAENISEDLDLVIYSPAVPEDNPELKQAFKVQNFYPPEAGKKFKIQIMSYPQALGKLSKDYFTIAVSGSHGKSTTSAMISLVLIKAGLDPTVILGTKLKEFRDSNFQLGSSNYLLIEADEYQASFLNYWPNIIVLTNVEEEHLDFFGRFENIFRAFRDYLNHLPEDGCLVVNYDDDNAKKIRQAIDVKNLSVKPYSLTLPEASQIKNILKIPGEYNVSNALAALMVARVLGISDDITLEALSEYQGAWRRFEIKEALVGDKQFTIVSDYAHHPTEVKVTLDAAREKWPQKDIWVIFQPHQYQRTFYLFKKLVEVFVGARAKKIILTPIYDVAGREKKEIKKMVSSLKLVEAIREGRINSAQDVSYIPSIEEVKSFLEKNLQGGEIVMIMGAGDIYELVKMFST